ncbi:hypothetical protein C8Q80DRAFT_133013 [Daedaleopsis nitida]|nr:hypothetical protein C8Q80DRAFT_133013 [Daedaleopsis nitida]
MSHPRLLAPHLKASSVACPWRSSRPQRVLVGSDESTSSVSYMHSPVFPGMLASTSAPMAPATYFSGIIDGHAHQAPSSTWESGVLRRSSCAADSGHKCTLPTPSAPSLSLRLTRAAAHAVHVLASAMGGVWSAGTGSKCAGGRCATSLIIRHGPRWSRRTRTRNVSDV